MPPPSTPACRSPPSKPMRRCPPGPRRPRGGVSAAFAWVAGPRRPPCTTRATSSVAGPLTRARQVAPRPHRSGGSPTGRYAAGRAAAPGDAPRGPTRDRTPKRANAQTPAEPPGGAQTRPGGAQNVPRGVIRAAATPRRDAAERGLAQCAPVGAAAKIKRAVGQVGFLPKPQMDEPRAATPHAIAAAPTMQIGARARASGPQTGQRSAERAVATGRRARDAPFSEAPAKRWAAPVMALRPWATAQGPAEELQFPCRSGGPCAAFGWGPPGVPEGLDNARSHAPGPDFDGAGQPPLAGVAGLGKAADLQTPADKLNLVGRQLNFKPLTPGVKTAPRATVDLRQGPPPRRAGGAGGAGAPYPGRGPERRKTDMGGCQRRAAEQGGGLR